MDDIQLVKFWKHSTALDYRLVAQNYLQSSKYNNQKKQIKKLRRQSSFCLP